MLLEVHIHIDLSELPRYLDNIEGVSGESADRFYDDAVYQTFFAVPQHSAEVISLFHACACYTFIRINIYEFVFGMSFTIFGVVFDLCGEGVKLVA